MLSARSDNSIVIDWELWVCREAVVFSIPRRQNIWNLMVDGIDVKVRQRRNQGWVRGFWCKCVMDGVSFLLLW